MGIYLIIVYKNHGDKYVYLYIYISIFILPHDLYPIILPRRCHRQVVFGGQLRGHLRSQRRVATGVEEVLL